MDGWKTIPFGMAHFQVQTVSFREGNFSSFVSFFPAQLACFSHQNKEMREPLMAELYRLMEQQHQTLHQLAEVPRVRDRNTGRRLPCNLRIKHRARWWFQRFFIFTRIWGDDPI